MPEKGKLYQIAFQIAGKTDPSFSSSFSRASGVIEKLGAGLGSLQRRLDLGTTWKSLSGKAEDTRQKLEGLRAKLRDLEQQGAASGNANSSLRAQYDRLKETIADTELKLSRQNEEVLQAQRAMDSAGLSTRNWADEQKKLQSQMEKMASVQTKLRNIAAKQEKMRSLKQEGKQQLMGSMGSLSFGVMAPVASMGAIVTLSAQYEKELNKIKAVGHYDAAVMDGLKSVIDTLGDTTEYSRMQVAQLGLTLTQAGFSADQAKKAMGAMLDAATASDMGLAETASIVGDTLHMFDIATENTTHVTDVLAKAANSANTNFAGMGESLKMVGGSARSAGLSLEETSAMVGMVADAGLKGTMGGTSINAMLSSFTSGKTSVENAFAGAGIAIRYADGNLRSMESILQDINAAADQMGSADKLAFFTKIAGKEGSRALSALLKIQKAGQYGSRVASLQSGAGGADNYTAEAASVMRSGVQGALNRLSSAIEGFGHSLMTQSAGKSLAGLIDDIAAGVGKLSSFLNNNPVLVEWGGKAAAALLGLKTATGLTKIAFGGLADTFYGAQKAFTLGKAAIDGVVKVQHLWNIALNANPIGLAVAAVAALTVAGIALYKNWDTVKAHCLDAWNSITGIVSSASEKIRTLWQNVVQWMQGTPKRILAPFAALPQRLSEAFSWFASLPDRCAGWLKTIPETLKEAVKHVPATLEGAFSWLSSLPSHCAEWFAAIPAKLTDALKPAPSALKDAFAWLGTLPDRCAEWFKALPEGLTEALKGIPATLTAAFSWFGTLPERCAGWMKALPDSLIEALKNVPARLAEAFSWFAALPDRCRTWLQALPDGLSEAVKSFPAVFAEAFSWFSALPDQCRAWLKTIHEGLSEAVKSIPETLIAAFSWFGTLPEQCRAWLKVLPDVLAEALAGFPEKISESFSWLGTLTEKCPQWLKALPEALTGVLADFPAKLADSFAWFAGLPERCAGWMKTLPDSLAEALKTFPAALEEGFSWFASLPDRCAEWFKSIPDALTEAVKNLPAVLGEAFARLGEWVKNRLTDMFTINISLPSWLGGSDSAEKASRARRALGGVTVTEQYASGTRTSGPTMALIGEGNAPEYVIPTESKYRSRALALWQSAGKELGVPMMAEGGSNKSSWINTPIKDLFDFNGLFSGIKNTLRDANQTFGNLAFANAILRRAFPSRSKSIDDLTIAISLLQSILLNVKEARGSIIFNIYADKNTNTEDIKTKVMEAIKQMDRSRLGWE